MLVQNFMQSFPFQIHSSHAYKKNVAVHDKIYGKLHLVCIHGQQSIIFN